MLKRVGREAMAEGASSKSPGKHVRGYVGECEATKSAAAVVLRIPQHDEDRRNATFADQLLVHCRYTRERAGHEGVYAITMIQKIMDSFAFGLGEIGLGTARTSCLHAKNFQLL